MKSLMDKYTIIRHKTQGASDREVERVTGINRKTVARYWKEYQSEIAKIENPEKSTKDVRDIQEKIVTGMKYDSSSRRPRVYTPELDKRIEEILEAEEVKNKILGRHKQGLTNIQIYKMITDEGFEISRSTLCAYLKEKRDKRKEAFIKQEYSLGDRLEYDFGDVKLVIAGIVSTYHMAVLASPAADFRWAYLYDNMKKAVFMDSHVRFFEMVGGVHKELVYDNMKNVVNKFIGRNEKEINEDLVKMSLYYGFKVNVTNCFSGNEKGFVESNVKKLQREVFAERYEFDTLEEAELYLQEKLSTINEGSQFENEKEHLLAYRPPLELGQISKLKVNKYSFIQVENNYYSVPEHLVGHWVKAKIYPKEILVYSDSRLVATHKKIDGYHLAQVDIYHYLETLEKKPGALKNSTALKSKAELKTIYDNHFTKRTKEFIELLRDNQDKSYPKLLEVLRKEASALPRAIGTVAVDEDSITNNTKKQLQQLSAMFKRGGDGYVN